MGMVFKKSYTMPVPGGAEIVERDGQRFARWRLRNGQQRSAEIVDCQDGKTRVRGQSKYFIARFRDGSGEIVEERTTCKDEVAARALLAQLERRAELVRAGVLSAAESDVADHAGVSLTKHLDAYQRHLVAKGGASRRISMLRARLDRLVEECKFTRLNRMSAGPVERWLVLQQEASVSAATRNVYRESLVCFGNWCRRTGRLTHNPFADLPRADQKCDRRHHRRALTEAELLRLLKVARLRPLAEYGREVVVAPPDPSRSKKSRATWTRVPLQFDDLNVAIVRAKHALRENPGLIESLERQGEERALVYKTLVLTGLRKNELATLTVGQIDFNPKGAIAILDPEDEKNREGSTIPLRDDLAAEVKSWMKKGPSPTCLAADSPVVYVPTGMTRIFDRDLKAAGIAKRDARGRVLDVHALRVTFGTHLCAAGVPLRVAQAAMRHSKPELTANIYTDPILLDIVGAINALPSLATTPAPARNAANA